MPSLYVGADLKQMVEEERKRLKRNFDDDRYISEAEALRELLNDDVREELT